MEGKNNDYFEGTLQLRNPDEKIINYVEKTVKESKKVFIARTVKTTNGVDLYLSSNKFLRSLGNKLKRKFRGELKESPQLFTKNRQTSKNVYRLNVMFRLHGLKIGDIVTVRDERIKITSVKKKVFGKELKTGKKVTVDYKELIK
ncbi:MAG: NMD3-related protein [Candidatus Woesearchaeota archaeon]|jgi:NMD protein affecting ribosome stability and mRNA decay|nr:NMD3-related protein [Candidatus Woesearchaeota archaeon]